MDMKKLQTAQDKVGGRFKLIAMMQKRLKNLRLAGIKQESGAGADHLAERVLDEVLQEPQETGETKKTSILG
jgi:hypothetical protein